MRHPIRSYLLLCLALLCAPLAIAAESPARFDEGLLWKIEQPGYQTGFLYGTIHVPDARVLQLKESVIRSMRASDVVATEAPMDDASLQAAGIAAMFDDGRRLDRLIGAEHYRQLTALMHERGVPAAAVPAFKPWSAMSLLVMPKTIEHPPLDIVLFRTGEQLGKRTTGLESIAEQLAVFDELPMKAQVAMLEATIDQQALIAPMVEHMLQLWLAEDTGALLDLAYEGNGMKMSAELTAFNDMMLDRLIDRRNELMATRLAGMLKEHRSFAAVGALHLPGPRGVLSLLAQRGFTITRVR